MYSLPLSNKGEVNTTCHWN